MTEDEQRAEKVKLLLEWTENEQELVRQRAKAARIADVLYHVSSMLRSEPDKLIFSNDSTPMHYMHREMIVETLGLDLTAIREVRDAIRSLQDRQRELKPRMAAFGL